MSNLLFENEGLAKTYLIDHLKRRLALVRENEPIAIDTTLANKDPLKLN